MNLELLMACLAAVGQRSGSGEGPARRPLGSAPRGRCGRRVRDGYPAAPDRVHHHPGP